MSRTVLAAGVLLGAAPTMPALAADGGDADEATVRLAPIVVEGAGETAYGPADGYSAERTGTATRTDVAVQDVPQSIQVVPREVIEDQKANRLVDVTNNVSNVQASSTFGNRSESFQIRGFQQFVVSGDGMPSNPFFGDQLFLDLGNVERVEVLKGPASVLYGQGDPGGVINLVTKKPLDEPYYAGDVTIGSHEFHRPTIDISSPLTQDKSVKARLNAAYQHNSSFRDYFVDAERSFVAPVVTWQAGSETLVTLSAEHNEQEQQFDRGLVAVGDGVADIPLDRYLGEAFSTYDADQMRLRYLVEHDFGGGWSLRNSFRYVTGEAVRLSADPRGLRADGRTLNRITSLQEDETREYRFQNDVLKEFSTGGLGHQVLVGLEAVRAQRDVAWADGALAPIDIFDPVYGAAPAALTSTPWTSDTLDAFGLYVQDQIDITEQWQALVGLRYDVAGTEVDRGSTVTEQTDQAFSPRFGLVYKPVQQVSLYGSYSQSFEPVVGTNFAGRSFDPEQGEQYEIGVKLDVLDGRLSATLAGFHLTRENVQTADPANPRFSVQTGEQRSQGVELDVAGEILPGWKVIASAGYVDAEVTADNSVTVGNDINNVPTVSGSLWSTYEFQGGGLEGLGFGGGLFAVGEREGDLRNTFTVDGYVRADATVFYRYNDNLSASLKVENLFDAEYIEAVASRTEIYPGAPQTVLGTVSVKF